MKTLALRLPSMRPCRTCSERANGYIALGYGNPYVWAHYVDAPFQPLKKPRFFGVPTNRSQRHTIEANCPDLLARCLADGVDAAILLPNCPICHQSLSLAGAIWRRRALRP